MQKRRAAQPAPARVAPSGPIVGMWLYFNVSASVEAGIQAR